MPNERAWRVPELRAARKHLMRVERAAVRALHDYYDALRAAGLPDLAAEALRSLHRLGTMDAHVYRELRGRDDRGG